MTGKYQNIWKNSVCCRRKNRMYLYLKQNLLLKIRMGFLKGRCRWTHRTLIAREKLEKGFSTLGNSATPCGPYPRDGWESGWKWSWGHLVTMGPAGPCLGWSCLRWPPTAAFKCQLYRAAPLLCEAGVSCVVPWVEPNLEHFFIPGG